MNDGSKIRTISAVELQQKMEGQAPDNEDRIAGYALVDVLAEKFLRKQHLPGAVNIPVRSAQRDDLCLIFLSYQACLIPESPDAPWT